MSTRAAPTDPTEDAFAELLEQFAPRVAASVDNFGVAVILEGSGISDRLARTRYDSADVVDLARKLRREVPSAPAHNADDAVDGNGSFWLCLLRGFTYVLAGIIVMTASGLLSSPTAAALVLGAGVASTGLMWGLSYLGHITMEQAPPDQRNAALAPLFAGGLTVAFGVGVLVGLFAGPMVGALAAAPLVYATTAATVLILRRHTLFAGTVLPGGTACVLSLTGVDWAPSAGWALSLSGFGLVVLIIAAARRVNPGGRRPEPVSRAAIRAAVPYIVNGLAIAGIVGGFVIALRQNVQLRFLGPREWFVLAQPLLIPLALGDVSVVALRRRVRRVAATTADRRSLARSARGALALLWLCQAALGATATALVLWSRPIADTGVCLSASLGFWAVGVTLVISLLTEPGPSAIAGCEPMLGATAMFIVLAVAQRTGTSTTMIWAASTTALVTLAVLTSLQWRRSGQLATYRWSM